LREGEELAGVCICGLPARLKLVHDNARLNEIDLGELQEP